MDPDVSAIRVASFAALSLLLTSAAMAATAHRVKVGKASLTFYWMIDEGAAQYRGPLDATLCDARGHVIARTSRKFRTALVREGSGRLRDGRAVMYVRKVHGEHRFCVIRATCGYGVTGSPLVPYRTAAVDPHFVKLGTRIYIPQLRGVRLPDGTIHDGIFIASDRGHFRGRHVDLFVGAEPHGTPPFERRGQSRVMLYRLEPTP